MQHYYPLPHNPISLPISFIHDYKHTPRVFNLYYTYRFGNYSFVLYLFSCDLFCFCKYYIERKKKKTIIIITDELAGGPYSERIEWYSWPSSAACSVHRSKMQCSPLRRRRFSSHIIQLRAVVESSRDSLSFSFLSCWLPFRKTLQFCRHRAPLFARSECNEWLAPITEIVRKKISFVGA